MGSHRSVGIALALAAAILAGCSGSTSSADRPRSTSTSRAQVTTSTVPAGTAGSVTLHLSTPFILSGTGSTTVTCRTEGGRTTVSAPETDTAAGVRVGADFSYAADGSTGAGRITVTLPSGITYPIDVTRPVTTEGDGGTVVFDMTLQGAQVQGDLQWGCSR